MNISNFIKDRKGYGSAWGKGVKLYALDIFQNLDNEQKVKALNAQSFAEFERVALNGAKDWAEYSQGGCSFIYDGDICERLATPSEQKRTKNGEKNPNSQETWLDCQARALVQASRLLYKAIICTR